MVWRNVALFGHHVRNSVMCLDRPTGRSTQCRTFGTSCSKFLSVPAGRSTLVDRLSHFWGIMPQKPGYLISGEKRGVWVELRVYSPLRYKIGGPLSSARGHPVRRRAGGSTGGIVSQGRRPTHRARGRGDRACRAMRIAVGRARKAVDCVGHPTCPIRPTPTTARPIAPPVPTVTSPTRHRVSRVCIALSLWTLPQGGCRTASPGWCTRVVPALVRHQGPHVSGPSATPSRFASFALDHLQPARFEALLEVLLRLLVSPSYPIRV